MKSFFKSRSFQYFLPFTLLIVGGSFALREFTELRYKYRKIQSFNLRDKLEKHGIELKKPEEVTLEATYEKMQKEDINNWENVRIPRPWDEEESK